MPSKQAANKSIGASIPTYDNIQQIAEQLSTEKGVPIKLSTALTLIVEFYLEAHKRDKK